MCSHMYTTYSWSRCVYEPNDTANMISLRLQTNMLTPNHLLRVHYQWLSCVDEWAYHHFFCSRLQHIPLTSKDATCAVSHSDTNDYWNIKWHLASKVNVPGWNDAREAPLAPASWWMPAPACADLLEYEGQQNMWRLNEKNPNLLVPYDSPLQTPFRGMHRRIAVMQFWPSSLCRISWVFSTVPFQGLIPTTSHWRSSNLRQESSCRNLEHLLASQEWTWAVATCPSEHLLPVSHRINTRIYNVC